MGQPLPLFRFILPFSTTVSQQNFFNTPGLELGSSEHDSSTMTSTAQVSLTVLVMKSCKARCVIWQAFVFGKIVFDDRVVEKCLG